MDPKALSHLDPKQREAYERVMGTAAQIHGDSSAPDISAAPVGTDQIPVSNGSSPFMSSTNDFTSQSTPTPDNTTPSPAQDFPLSSSPSEPFDTNAMGLSSSPLGDMPSGLDPLNPTGTTNASPSIFTTPPDEPSSDLAAAPNSSFFTSPTPDSSEPSADASDRQAFEATTEPTIASDNLSPITPVAPYTPDNTTDPISPQPFSDPLPSPADVTQANTPHETSALLKVLYIVGAVVFFAIYTIFWVKVFNLPFLF
ncbi:MAG: hypothetical protein H0W89_06920 [Candidatus Levybacteria bacterium]|nr:hypothetical protein [Candidatus Levybacteria bacterium]